MNPRYLPKLIFQFGYFIINVNSDKLLKNFVKISLKIQYNFKYIYRMQNQKIEIEDKDYTLPFDEKDLKNIDESYSHKQLIELLKEKKFDYALGSIFGACIGDALGSYCQFQRNMTSDMLDNAMQMQGGGCFNTFPGQLTDDSELALHMIQGLCHYDSKVTLQDQVNKIIYQIALQYVKWFQSGPFDIGHTCRNAFVTIRNQIPKIKAKDNIGNEDIKKIHFQISVKNSQSESNGSLMRITPMVFFASFVNGQNSVQELIQKQIKLTHSAQKAVYAGKAWAQLLLALIARKNNDNLLEIRDKVLSNYKQTLLEWIEKANQSQMMQATKNIGWAKIGWSMGFYKLKQIAKQGIKDQTYKKILRDVIGGGGDTDTNAAIVGGMVGSLVGFKKLPRQYLQKSMKLKFVKADKYRPVRKQFYEPKTMLIKAIQLFRKMKK